MTGPHEYALMPLGARPRFPVKDPALAVAWVSGIRHGP